MSTRKTSKLKFLPHGTEWIGRHVSPASVASSGQVYTRNKTVKYKFCGYWGYPEVMLQ